MKIEFAVIIKMEEDNLKERLDVKVNKLVLNKYFLTMNGH
jgi:hypothetical protein